MHSFLWDDFCENQGVIECEEIVDLCSSGVLKQLMTHNLTRNVSYDCIYYPDGTADEDGPFIDYTTYHVDAYPAQSELITFRNGMEISHDGPDACNNQLIHRGAPPSGAGGPSVFLYYNRYPEFWGNTFKNPPWLHYTRSITRASKAGFEHYIRVVSYSDDEMKRHQMWKEIIIDTEISMAVLFARHIGSDVDNVWTMVHLEERNDWRQPELKTFDYHWSIGGQQPLT